MTLDEMRTAVYRRLGDKGFQAGGTVPTSASLEEVRLELSIAAKAVAMDVFQQGVTLIVRSVDFTVVSGTQEYPLSTGALVGAEAAALVTGASTTAGQMGITDDDFMAVLLLEERTTPGNPSTYCNCAFVDGGDFRRKNPNRGTLATGEKVYLRGQRLGFVAVPSAADAYTLHYAPRPAALTEDDHAVDKLKATIPEEYHPNVVQSAVVELYAAEDSPAADRARVKAYEMRAALLATVSTRYRQGPHYRGKRRR